MSDADLRRRFRSGTLIYVLVCILGVALFIPFNRSNAPPPTFLMIFGPVMGFYQLDVDSFAIGALCNLVVFPFFIATCIWRNWIVGIVAVLLWFATGYVCYSINAI